MNAVAAVFYRDFRQRTTNVAWLFWDLFVPVAYLVLFGTGFERAFAGNFAVGGESVGYVAFLLPGVIAMASFGVAMNTSWSFFMDKDSGIFYELLTYPITREQLLIGKICFNVLLAATGTLLVIAVGVLAMGVEVRWGALPLTFLAVAVTTAGWFFMFSIFAVRMRRMDTFNTFTSAAYIVLMFISAMFYPLEELPPWFRGAALLNPMTWQVDLLRHTLLGVGAGATVLLEALAFGAFTLLCLFFAARAISRAA
ncbi:MAG TPA: ABC transporter permease [Thermoanaerobaculia bacterium]